ncbi:MAG: hypoxanthine-guanine phosphoribosyltransferase [Gammaproteobacteria bacterium]|nr:hypoxanthine-guanine phosphoribosyltransferase [Gammaproteobacteria bacterium]
MATSHLPPGCRLIYDNATIIAALDELAAKLNRKLAHKDPIVLTVMQGGLIFAGHIIPRLKCMLEIDYIHVSRYNNETSGGDMTWKAYPASVLKDRTVLILDDILDEGHTLQSIIQYCESQGAKEVLSAVLVKKNHKRCVEHEPLDRALTDNIALTVDDNYVFGFGMDYNGQYRQLDAIYKI